VLSPERAVVRNREGVDAERAALHTGKLSRQPFDRKSERGAETPAVELGRKYASKLAVRRGASG
jgi:hypothetical protein